MIHIPSVFLNNRFITYFPTFPCRPKHQISQIILMYSYILHYGPGFLHTSNVQPTTGRQYAEDKRRQQPFPCYLILFNWNCCCIDTGSVIPASDNGPHSGVPMTTLPSPYLRFQSLAPFSPGTTVEPHQILAESVSPMSLSRTSNQQNGNASPLITTDSINR